MTAALSQRPPPAALDYHNVLPRAATASAAVASRGQLATASAAKILARPFKVLDGRVTFVTPPYLCWSLYERWLQDGVRHLRPA